MASTPSMIKEYASGGAYIYPTPTQSGSSSEAVYNSQSPTQPSKRRRISRACDECRKRKSKCDGKNPCKNCAYHQLNCTYCKPSNRPKRPNRKERNNVSNSFTDNHSPDQPRILAPKMDLHHSGEDVSISERGNNSIASEFSRTWPSHESEGQVSSTANHHLTPELRQQMVRSENICIEPQTHSEVVNWDFYGDSSGSSLVRHIREYVSDVLSDFSTSFSPAFPHDTTPSYSTTTLLAESPNKPCSLGDLPPFEQAKALCEAAFSETEVLYCFIHLPTFYQTLVEIYTLTSNNQVDGKDQFLTLLFSILALGWNAQKKGYNKRSRSGDVISEARGDEGQKYFTSARNAIDVDNCETMPQLQTVIFLALYLQDTAELNLCYSYIRSAQRSALRMGLHKNLTNKCDPIELEVKRRVFWTLQKIDTSMSAILGYAKILDLDSIDQEMPTEVDSMNNTEIGMNVSPVTKPSTSLQAANAHMRLIVILDKVIKYIYPNNRVGGYVHDVASSGHVVDHAVVREIEKDLRQWCQGLAFGTHSSRCEELQNYRMHQFLRLSHAHVQMLLYRPFLPFIFKEAFVDEKKNRKSQACAFAYIEVCKNVIQIVKDLQKRGIVIGPSWLMVNITSFATLSLVYFNCKRTYCSGSSNVDLDACMGVEVPHLKAQRERDAHSYVSALKTLSNQLRSKTKPTVSARSAPTHAREKCPPSLILSNETNRSETGSNLSQFILEEVPNCQAPNHISESGQENSNDNSNLAMNTPEEDIFEFINFEGNEGLEVPNREPTDQNFEAQNKDYNDSLNLDNNHLQDPACLPRDTLEQVIFELINFEEIEGIAGLETPTDNVFETTSLDLGSMQNSSSCSNDLAVKSMSVGEFLQAWSYDNGEPEIEEMIEAGVCLEESRYGKSHGL